MLALQCCQLSLETLDLFLGFRSGALVFKLQSHRLNGVSNLSVGTFTLTNALRVEVNISQDALQATDNLCEVVLVAEELDRIDSPLEQTGLGVLLDELTHTVCNRHHVTCRSNAEVII